MSDKELPEGLPSYLGKMKYEHALARFTWGFVRAAIVAFVIGKLVGYFGFLSWWYVPTPFLLGLLASGINYLKWVPKSRILLYTVGTLYGILRYAIIRLFLWTPMFLALFTGFCISKRYGTSTGMNAISSVAAIATYWLTTYLTGRSPGMPSDKI